MPATHFEHAARLRTWCDADVIVLQECCERSRADWAEVMSRLAAETDYGNFKSKVRRHQGPSGATYEHALHDVGR